VRFLPIPTLVTNDSALERVYEEFTVNVGGEDVYEDTLEGRPHLVVPAVILVEGVLHGSHGPGFYPKEESGRRVHAWNHMPAVVNHPKVGDRHVTARSKEMIDLYKAGVVLNSLQDDTKTKTKVWLDIARTNGIDARIIPKLRKREKIELSTGLFVHREMTSGVFTNAKGDKVPYDWIARDHEPDHLAILVDSVGACSVKDGAGLLANETRLPESLCHVLRRSVEKCVLSIGVDKVTGNEMSFTQVSQQLGRALSSKFGSPGEYWRGYVVEVFDDRVVFEGEDDKLYQMSYSVSGDSVQLTGDAKEVKRQVSYVAARSAVPSPQESEMFDKKKHIDSLIGNGFEESDRVWLDKLTDDQLKKVQPRAAAVSPPPPATTTNQTPPVAAQTPAPVTPLTMDQLRQILPPSFFVVHEQGQMALNQAKSAYKQKIMADVNNKFSEAQLDAMDWQTLAAVAEMARPTAQVTTPPTAGPFLNGWTPNVMPFGGGGNWSGSQGPIPTAVGGNGVTNTVGTHEPLGLPVPDYGPPPGKAVSQQPANN
jgi:hypothetical protein